MSQKVYFGGVANVGPPQEERERTNHDSLNVVNRGREKDIRELGGKKEYLSEG